MENPAKINGATIVAPEVVVGQVTPSNNVKNLSVIPENMNGKPVLYRDAKTVLNMKSAFSHKLLCTGPVLNLGDACGYSCEYCYVEDAMRKLLHDKLGGHVHQDVVMRRRDALRVLREQLEKNKQKHVPHVVYSSSLVDIAANTGLMKETAEACTIILEETVWHIRLLTKSNLLPRLVALIPGPCRVRLILGVSTGTFDDGLGQVIEKNTPLVSKRIESLHWLQDNGYRTFAMVCPSLPQDDYDAFAQGAAEILRYDRCENVWAEVINVRGESFTRTIAALDSSGLIEERDKLAGVCGDGDGAHDRWEEYARATFEAHSKVVGPEKLRFLQYINRKQNIAFWEAQKLRGAVLLGRYGVVKKKRKKKAIAPSVEVE
jgi:DNA repair photolyase